MCIRDRLDTGSSSNDRTRRSTTDGTSDRTIGLTTGRAGEGSTLWDGSRGTSPQLAPGSTGYPDTTAREPPWRRRTRCHNPSGSAETGSFGSAFTTYHDPSSISSSSCPASQPAYPENLSLIHI